LCYVIVICEDWLPPLFCHPFFFLGKTPTLLFLPSPLFGFFFFFTDSPTPFLPALFFCKGFLFPTTLVKGQAPTHLTSSLFFLPVQAGSLSPSFFTLWTLLTLLLSWLKNVGARPLLLPPVRRVYGHLDFFLSPFGRCLSSLQFIDHKDGFAPRFLCRFSLPLLLRVLRCVKAPRIVLLIDVDRQLLGPDCPCAGLTLFSPAPWQVVIGISFSFDFFFSQISFATLLAFEATDADWVPCPHLAVLYEAHLFSFSP